MTGLATAERAPALDGVRGIAALSVFAFHGWFFSNWPPAGDQPGWAMVHALMASGWSGVDLFFTLSGFLLAWPFVEAQLGRRKPVDLRRYAQRRMLRIFPAFWLQLLVIGLCWPGIEASAADWLVQAGLAFHLGMQPASPWMAVWWTLPVEVGFYLLLPLLALCLRPRWWPGLLLVVVAAWLYRHQLLQLELPRRMQLVSVDHLPGRIDQFVIGALGAYAWVRGGRDRWREPVRVRWLTVAAIAAPIAVHAIGALPDVGRVDPSPDPRPWLVGWHGYASVSLLPLLWLCATGVGRLPGLLQAPPLAALGRWSYGLYLWHLPLMLLAREQLAWLPEGPSRPLLFTLLLLPPSLLLAAASWRFIERPALALARGGARTRALRSA